MEEAFLLIGEEGIRHPYFVHHFLSHGNLFVFVGELFDDEAGISPKLAEVQVNGEILQKNASLVMGK
jgi:hypothetical protein